MKTMWAAAWCVVCLALSAAGARGQAMAFGGPSYDPLALPVTVGEAAFLANRAGLDESTGQAARALTESAASTIRREAGRMQRAVERAHTLHPRSEREIIVKEINEARAAQEQSHQRATQSLLADLRALVPEGRRGEESWAAFERRRHRRLYLTQSARVGTGVDLVRIAEGERIENLAAVRELLDVYEVELDRLLVARHPVALDEYTIEPAVERGDLAEAERLFNSLRDLDCAILRVQRTFAARLLDAAPVESRDKLRSKVLRERSFLGDYQDPLRHRAQRLVESGRLSGERLSKLAAAIRLFDQRDLAMDEAGLTEAEDRECTLTFAQSRSARDNTAALQRLEESRQLRAELLRVMESTATDEDFDAIQERTED